MRYPDNPTPISSDLLKQFDADPPGTWLAQPKLDGWRRIAVHDGTQWRYHAKPHGAGAAIPAVEADLQDEFEALPWPPGLGLDMEWVGPRHAGAAHSLHVFDMFQFGGAPGFEEPFEFRYGALDAIWQTVQSKDARVHLVPVFANPGLLDRFLEQMQDPRSEGLVLRRADSTLIGKRNACATNPHVFKVKFK